MPTAPPAPSSPGPLAAPAAAGGQAPDAGEAALLERGRRDLGQLRQRGFQVQEVGVGTLRFSPPLPEELKAQVVGRKAALMAALREEAAAAALACEADEEAVAWPPTYRFPIGWRQ